MYSRAGQPKERASWERFPPRGPCSKSPGLPHPKNPRCPGRCSELGSACFLPLGVASASSSAHCEPRSQLGGSPNLQPHPQPNPRPPPPPAPAALLAPRGPGAPGGGGRKCESDGWRSSTSTLYRGRWGGRSGSEVLVPSPAGFPLSAAERVNGLQSKETELHHADDAWARTLMLGEVFFVIIIIIILVEKKVE